MTEKLTSLMQVGWDESTAGDRQPRVSLWEIEPLTTFPMYSSPFPLRLKRPWPPGLPSFHGILIFCKCWDLYTKDIWAS